MDDNDKKIDLEKNSTYDRNDLHNAQKYKPVS